MAEAFNALGEFVAIPMRFSVSLSTRALYLPSPLFPGSMYQHGQGVEESMEEAVKHYTSGGELGEAARLVGV